MRTRRIGFTLIELVVAVGLIFVLAGLLLSALNVVRERSRRTVTMRLMEQVGTAILLYLDRYPLLGDVADATSSDFANRPAMYLVSRRDAGGVPYLELGGKNLAKGATPPFAPASANDAEHILDAYRANSLSNRLVFVITNKAGGPSGYEATLSVEIRSTVGTTRTSDDLVYRYTREAGRFEWIGR